MTTKKPTFSSFYPAYDSSDDSESQVNFSNTKLKSIQSSPKNSNRLKHHSPTSKKKANTVKKQTTKPKKRQEDDIDKYFSNKSNQKPTPRKLIKPKPLVSHNKPSPTRELKKEYELKARMKDIEKSIISQKKALKSIQSKLNGENQSPNRSRLSPTSLKRRIIDNIESNRSKQPRVIIPLDASPLRSPARSPARSPTRSPDKSPSRLRNKSPTRLGNKSPTRGNKSPSRGNKSPSRGNKSPSRGNKSPSRLGNKTPRSPARSPTRSPDRSPKRKMSGKSTKRKERGDDVDVLYSSPRKSAKNYFSTNDAYASSVRGKRDLLEEELDRKGEETVYQKRRVNGMKTVMRDLTRKYEAEIDSLKTEIHILNERNFKMRSHAVNVKDQKKIEELYAKRILDLEETIGLKDREIAEKEVYYKSQIENVKVKMEELQREVRKIDDYEEQVQELMQEVQLKEREMEITKRYYMEKLQGKTDEQTKQKKEWSVANNELLQQIRNLKREIDLLEYENKKLGGNRTGLKLKEELHVVSPRRIVLES